MRKKVVSILASTLCIVFIVLNSSVLACTVFNASNDDKALVGRNMDWYTQENFMAFFPPKDGEFGRVYFGWNNFPSWYQGGMNDQGVMFAYLAAPYLKIRNSLLKHIYHGNFGNLMEKCMEECSSVDEVLIVFDQYNLQFLENCQVMVLDQTGNSAIIEGDDIVIKDGVFQVVTNFYHSHPDLGWYPCWRYNRAFELLETMTDFSVEYFTEICNATHQEGNYPTQWSIVYDLKKYDIYLYHYHNYQDAIVFNLHEELELGEHIYSIPSLFEPFDNHPPEQPPRPIGPNNGRTGSEISFTIGPAIDPEEDDLYYVIDWGDGSTDDYGPYQSGSTYRASYVWDKNGSYEIKVKAVDIYGSHSNWSDPFTITMPKPKSAPKLIFLQFLERLVDRFSFAH